MERGQSTIEYLLGLGFILLLLSLLSAPILYRALRTVRTDIAARVGRDAVQR